MRAKTSSIALQTDVVETDRESEEKLNNMEIH